VSKIPRTSPLTIASDRRRNASGTDRGFNVCSPGTDGHANDGVKENAEDA
jgi:hypothetical protein